MFKSNNFRVFIFFIIGLFLLKWVYDFFNGSDAVELINEHKKKLFFLFFAHLPTLYFDSIAWFVLLKKKSISFFWSFIITWISQTSGKFFPTGNITGEFVRIYLGIKKGLSSYEASSTVFADLIIATLSLFIIAIFSLVLILFSDFNLINTKESFYLYTALFVIFLGCLLFFFLVRKRLIKYLIRQINKRFNFSLNKKQITFFIKLDISLFYLMKRKNLLLKALFYRLLGWFAGAIEIYVFLFLIDIEVSILDVILIESFSGVIRAVVFFIPAGIGVQELAFVLIGDFVGLSPTVSFSVAIGRRIREFLVGFPAVFGWFYFLEKFKW